ncbi:MAG TPA: GspH/FimT family pseudopilin [Gemmatimonadota bacterium]|nr:GspH/FimT family pseudopilin [Gemmatimonadota bacterium]
MRPSGFTLLEVLIALTLCALVSALSMSGYRRWRDATALAAASRAARGQLALARSRAVARRERLRVRVVAGALVTLDDAGAVVDRTILVGADLRTDSVRLRPATLSFNPRGQAAPGSLYLFRGARGVRIVCNFVGRIRVAGFDLPDG